MCVRTVESLLKRSSALKSDVVAGSGGGASDTWAGTEEKMTQDVILPNFDQTYLTQL